MDEFHTIHENENERGLNAHGNQPIPPNSLKNSAKPDTTFQDQNTPEIVSNKENFNLSVETEDLHRIKKAHIV